MGNAKEWVMPTHIIASSGIVINENEEILLVKHNLYGWSFPGGQIEVGENVIDGLKREIMEETGIEAEIGEVFCISSNTSKHPGRNGVKEIPTKIMLDFICRCKNDTPRPSDENSESRFFPKEKVMSLIIAPAYRERFQAYLEYSGRPTYLEYVTHPVFERKVNRLI